MKSFSTQVPKIITNSISLGAFHHRSGVERVSIYIQITNNYTVHYTSWHDWVRCSYHRYSILGIVYLGYALTDPSLRSNVGASLYTIQLLSRNISRLGQGFWALISHEMHELMGAKCVFPSRNYLSNYQLSVSRVWLWLFYIGRWK